MHSEKACIHCGADCGKNPVLWDDKHFCCNGCLQVYRILNEHKLTQYYTLAKLPGIKTEEVFYKGKYSFLDKEEIKLKMYEFHEGTLATVTLYIPAIHCISCIWLLENLNKLNPGISQSSVNFVQKRCSITFNTDEISIRQLVELLVSVHYVPEISLQMLEGGVKPKKSRALLNKIGVAGFISGNVMLFSLPLYFNGKPLEDSLGVFFSYISFLLTLPLVFYCGSDYIISAYKSLQKKLINIDLPIAIGIITLFAVTTFDVFSGRGQGYSDSLSGFLFFLLLGKWYQSKTYEALSFDRDYKSYFPIAVTRIVDEIEENVLLKDIQVGDVLLVRNKEMIPADSMLIDGIGLIDYSFVSGESTPIRKEKGEPLYAGGIQVQGAILIKVAHEVSQSHLTQLWNRSEVRQPTAKPLLPFIDRVSVWFTAIIISLAAFGFIYWWFFGKQFHEAVLVFTSVLIITCPCALALAFPFTLGNSLRLLGHKGIYLKNIQTLENLTHIDTIVFDKTGTITVPDQSNIRYSGQPLSSEQIIAITSLVRQSTHPLSQALSKYFEDSPVLPVTGFVEVSGKGSFGLVSGSKIRLGSANYIGCSDQQPTDSAASVYISINDQYLGFFSIGNKYRDGFLELVKLLKKDFRLFLLSGDNSSEKSVLKNYFDENALFFDQAPQDKMDFIHRLQEKGYKVMMAGDGLNDAGAFMQSHVALSVADDIYHFSPAADIIIDSAKLSMIAKLHRFARFSLNMVRASFVVSFIYNIAGLTYALSGQMTPVIAAILMPISSVTVVALAIFGTNLIAKKVLR